jgi:hypothetical protein
MISLLFLAVGTWLGWRNYVIARFDIGSNSSIDSPGDLLSDLLAEQLYQQRLAQQLY